MDFDQNFELIKMHTKSKYDWNQLKLSVQCKYIYRYVSEKLSIQVLGVSMMNNISMYNNTMNILL